MSEITQSRSDLSAQDTNSRVTRANAASDQSPSNKQSEDQRPTKNTGEAEQEKRTSHHDPAVTLASTLAKLDSGSHFPAKVTGHEADGRAIIVSELGTYLVQADQKYAQEVRKLPPETQLEIRIITVDKEIKAEIIRTQVEGAPVPTTVIPVELILTEITGSSANQALPQTPPVSAILLEDVRSQYQATTLYRAERMAREIADKLDNLPLPTSSPNYTVYKPQTSETQTQINLAPQRVAPNVFIQEVAPQAAAQLTPNTSVKLETPLTEQILGQNINVQVIKTVPQVQIPLPAGLPDAVIKEISAATPLDSVNLGQGLTINIVALAVPEPRGQQSPITEPRPPQQTATANPQTTAVSSNALIPNKPNLPNLGTPEQKTIISGIVIDTQQKTVSAAHPGHAAINTPYNQKNGPQTFLNTTKQTDDKGNNYYLATPTSVLKFQSAIPLVPGTIVSFSVQPNDQPRSTETTTQPTVQQTTTTATQVMNTNDPAIKVAENATAEANRLNASPVALERIEQLIPQDLNQLPDDWASISLTLASLQSANAASVAAIMSSRIPNMQNPEQLTSTMLFFLAAIKAPQPARTWVGPDVSARLKQLGAGKALDRMDQDFTRIARLSADSPAGEWRPLLIPMQTGSDISAIPMLVKQIAEEDKNNKNQQNKNDENEVKIKATRFILELKLSQFGTMIIDGMLKEKRLDIILKAAKKIPFTIKMKLSRQYTDAIHKNGFDGELVVIDNSPTEFSVRKMLETMTHKDNFEKKI